MKKLALVLMALSASIFGLSAVANAYPPAPNVAVVSDSTPVAGQIISVTFGCDPSVDEFVRATFRAAFVSSLGVSLEWAPVPTITPATCNTFVGPASLLFSAPAAGTATLEITAPSEPGTYTVDYTGAATGSFSFTVTGAATPAAPGGGLPATGSNGTGTMTIMAIGLFAVGAGLFGVSQVRRRTVAA